VKKKKTTPRNNRDRARDTGKTWDSKLDATRDKIKAMGCDAMVVTALDEIAWLLNIRGYDIPYGPFLKSYAIVSKDQLHLYTDPEKLSPDVRRHLRTENCFSAHCARSDRARLRDTYTYELKP